MLSMNNYTQKYIDECCLKVNLQLSTYKNLVTTARKQVGDNNALLNSVIESFEPNFFNNMVIVLDSYFCHRSRTLEKKDGNPLNEVRILCNSMMNNNNKMLADKTIKFVPDKSVLKYKVGDEIKLNEDDFILISKAFFAEIESKYL
jgi:hypothetical protein